MKKKNGIEYFQQEWKGMHAHLKSYLKKEEQEDLHQFRVKVKKIKAFLILSDNTTKHRSMVEQFKPVKKIYKQAGVLRDAYLNQEFMKLLQPDNEIDQDILIKNSTIDFKSNGDKYLRKIKRVHQTLKKEIKSIKDAAINRFYEVQLRQIAEMLTWHQFYEQLHDCRKRIKILLYNNKPAHKSLSIKLNEDYLDHLQQAVGDWHDQVLSISRLSEDMASATTLIDATNERLAKLKGEIDSLKENFYHRAIVWGTELFV